MWHLSVSVSIHHPYGLQSAKRLWQGAYLYCFSLLYSPERTQWYNSEGDNRAGSCLPQSSKAKTDSTIRLGILLLYRRCPENKVVQQKTRRQGYCQTSWAATDLCVHEMRQACSLQPEAATEEKQESLQNLYPSVSLCAFVNEI